MSQLFHNMNVLNFLSNVIAGFVGYILYLTFMGIGQTIRVDIKNYSGEELFKNENFIFAIWHRDTFLPIYLHRNLNISIYVSKDLKGKILGVATCRLGFDPFPLEQNHARSIIKMLKKLKKKQNIVMAVDGPKGPVMHIKDGAQFLGKRSGVPIIAVAVHYTWAFTLFWRWDKHRIPLPFSRATVTFSSLFDENSDWSSLYHALGLGCY